MPSKADGPIVIIHGWSDNASSFQDLARFLRQNLNRPVEFIHFANWISQNDNVIYADLR